MGDHEDGDVQPEHDLGELPATRRIEVGRGLVQDEDLRPHREHRRHRDPTPLPERQVVRRPIGVCRHPHHRERLTDAGVEFRSAQAEVRGPESHVVADGRHEQLVVGVLEDDAHPAADLGQGVPADRHTGDLDRATPGADVAPEDSVEVQHEGRLAGTVGPEQGHPFAAVDVQIDPGQCACAIGIGEGEAADVEHRSRHRPTTPHRAAIAATAGSAAAAMTSVRRTTTTSRAGSDPA